MALIPPPTDSTLSRIWKHWESKQSKRHRNHLGASQIGRECEREIWYSFRWAKPPSFEGRILRLFESGRNAEAILAADLRATGATVLECDPDTGEQFQFSEYGGHFSGSMDGAGVGFVEAPATWHVIEYKTHNDKSFKDVSENGVEKSKPEHFAQMQTYMGWSGMTRAMYVALNKNTDEIYIERIDYDAKEFKRIKQKAKEIIFADAPPPRMNESPAFYKCKWCQFNSICHEQGEVAHMNCRTCEHSTALEDGSWACDRHNMILTTAGMEVGCADHRHREGMAPEPVRKVVEAFNGKVIEKHRKAVDRAFNAGAEEEGVPFV